MHILFKTNKKKPNFLCDDDTNHNKVTNGNNRTHTTARMNQTKKKEKCLLGFADTI
jgi:hypothetical protein